MIARPACRAACRALLPAALLSAPARLLAKAAPAATATAAKPKLGAAAAVAAAAQATKNAAAAAAPATKLPEVKIFDQLFVAPKTRKAPYVKAAYYLCNGQLKPWNGEMDKVYSPLYVQGGTKPECIGEVPSMTEKESFEVVDAASKAYNNGVGTWPQMSTAERIAVVEKFVDGLKAKRNEIVELLMWEICKPLEDARKEVDRTITYIKDTIAELKSLENTQSTFKVEQGIVGQIRRAPLGVVLCLGPYNYPLNETYTTLIPALIMGNTVVMKLPKFGLLAHIPTLDIFAKCFPPGVVNVISGNGFVIMPPLMKSGKVDVFGFIGSNKSADALIKYHPQPHRLRVCLGLDAKNPGIVLPSADLNNAINECLLGTLSYNGQRCTALKILFVHESIAQRFAEMFSAAVDNLKMGLPWDTDVKITALPDPEKPAYLKKLIDEAVSKGAKIMNKRGSCFDRTMCAPTVLYPVNSSMAVYHEEQFGPVVGIVPFKDFSDASKYIVESQYGQQASIFGTDDQEIARLVDVLVNQVSRVNINSQCQRGPDTFPFTGRKDSAMGTLSVHDALRVFSIRALVACKETRSNQQVITNIIKKASSHFLRLDHLF